MSTEDLQPYAPHNVAAQRTGQAKTLLTVGSRDADECGQWYSPDAVLAILADAHAHYAAQVLPRAGLAQPAGDAEMPPLPDPGGYRDVDGDWVRHGHTDAAMKEYALAAIAARDAHMSSMRAEITEARITIAELKADLRERDERIAIIRTEWAAEVAALAQRARSLDWNKEFEENVGRPPTDEDRKLMGVSE